MRFHLVSDLRLLIRSKPHPCRHAFEGNAHVFLSALHFPLQLCSAVAHLPVIFVCVCLRAFSFVRRHHDPLSSFKENS